MLGEVVDSGCLELEAPGLENKAPSGLEIARRAWLPGLPPGQALSPTASASGSCLNEITLTDKLRTKALLGGA
jgi:hypothetical protein